MSWMLMFVEYPPETIQLYELDMNVSYHIFLSHSNTTFDYGTFFCSANLCHSFS